MDLVIGIFVFLIIEEKIHFHSSNIIYFVLEKGPAHNGFRRAQRYNFTRKRGVSNVTNYNLRWEVLKFKGTVEFPAERCMHRDSFLLDKETFLCWASQRPHLQAFCL